MVSIPMMYAMFSAAFGISALVFLYNLRRFPDSLQRFAWPIVIVCGLASLSTFASMFEFGVVYIFPGNEIAVNTFVEYGISYPLLVALSVYIAGGSRRRLLQAAGFVEGLVWVNAAAQGSPSPWSFLLFFGSLAFFFALVWLLVRPIWETAQQQTESRRLLYWKFRNLLVFGITMLLLTGLLVPEVSGIFSDFVGTVAVSYVEFVIRVGFGAFLFTNIDAFEGVDRETTDTAPASPDVTPS